jgi:hypothetical protein
MRLFRFLTRGRQGDLEKGKAPTLCMARHPNEIFICLGLNWKKKERRKRRENATESCVKNRERQKRRWTRQFSWVGRCPRGNSVHSCSWCPVRITAVPPSTRRVKRIRKTSPEDWRHRPLSICWAALNTLPKIQTQYTYVYSITLFSNGIGPVCLVHL